MVTIMTLSNYELSVELRRLIELVSSPFVRVHEPQGFEVAVDELKSLMSNPQHWQVLLRIKPGKQSNHGLKNLGKKRVGWLRQFCIEECGYTEEDLRVD